MRPCALAVSVVGFLGAVPASAQSFTVVTDPPGATIVGLDKSGNRVQLGLGTAKVKLEKSAANRFWISADGFATLDTTFIRDLRYPKSVTIRLVNRLVKVTALPYDAQIRVNGELRGTGNTDVVVPPGIPVTVEVTKGGFKPERRVYDNEPGTELPISERFELHDLLVNVQPSLPRSVVANTVMPSVSVDGREMGTGNVDVVVPLDRCVTVNVALPGYKPEPRTLCNKADQPKPDPVLKIALVDRLVALTVTPQDAEIWVDGKIVAAGSFNLIVRDQACVNVVARLVGYASQLRQFCNTDNRSIDAEARIELGIDESYTSSVQTDQANVNVTMEVGASRSGDQAWQTISQVVLTSFDVLEITDKDTGYMRTSWEVTKFSNAVIRTRVIVKLGSTSPLKYVVKIASERSDDPNASVKDDELFSEWDRLLKSYKDIINELQARLR